jgi:hypothetical protein
MAAASTAATPITARRAIFRASSMGIVPPVVRVADGNVTVELESQCLGARLLDLVPRQEGATSVHLVHGPSSVFSARLAGPGHEHQPAGGIVDLSPFQT